MRPGVIIILMLASLLSLAQADTQAGKQPVFKQVTHPFMPPITSDFFFFSGDGLIWFSTAAGLASFDGSEIVYYSTEEQGYKLGLNRIRSMAEDSEHNLYIGGANKLIFFDRKQKAFTPIVYPFKKGEPSDISTGALFISDRVYIGTIAKGLLIYDPGTKTFEQINLVAGKADRSNNSVISFAKHADDPAKLWLGTYNGIYLFHKNKKTLARNFEVTNPGVNKMDNSPIYYDIRKMDVANDSTIWFSTAWYGFGKYNCRTGSTSLFIHHARLNVPSLWKAYTMREFAKWTPDNYILGICDPSPGIFDKKRETLQLFKLAQEPAAYDDVQYATNDQQGNVWIMSKGLLYASIPDNYRLKTVSIEKQLTQDYLANQLGDIYFDKETSLYYAAVPFSSGVYVLDTTLTVVNIIPAPLYTNRYTYKETSNEWITRDGSGRFWTSCLETYILLPGQKKFEYAEKIFPSLSWLKTRGESWDIKRTKEGNVLLRFIDGVIYHINHRSLHTDSIIIPDYKWQHDHSIGTTRISYDSVRDKVYLNNFKYIIQHDLHSGKTIPLTDDLLFGKADRGSQAIEYAIDEEGRIWVWIPKFGIRIIDPDRLVCVDSIPAGSRGLIAGNYTYLRYGGKDCMFLIGQRGLSVYNYNQQKTLLFDNSNGWSRQDDYFKGYANRHLFISGRNCFQYYNLDNFSKFNFTVKPFLNTIMAGSTIVFTRGSDVGETVRLPYYQNSLNFSFSAPEFYFPERIEYSYQLVGADKEWQYTQSVNRRVIYTRLSPGKYIFRLKAQMQGGNWNAAPVEYIIIIVPAWWQTNLFKIVCGLIVLGSVFYFNRQRIQSIRKKERQKAEHEKELLELEAKALRAQMNPHFIFNSLNSIKSLINKKENDKAAGYLTTFSKLIRTLFQNSDRREVSLYEELETCKLYTQLEQMRFSDKVKFIFDVDESIDLKDIKVPALILQPFIENAIWHGLVPKESGGKVIVSVKETNGAVECIIDDDGIGRELSNLYKAQYETTHQSKGIGLTQSRLDLDKLLNEREDSVEIIDKINEDGKPEGTKIIITFKENRD
jgi:anti-sigma regulatory factor (Ser/Thr protein kinase)